MATDSKSRFKAKIKPPKFSWLNDPADAQRGSGTAVRTPDQLKSMLEYNKQLVEPMDRGGGTMIRQNGQPERLAGQPRVSQNPDVPPIKPGFNTPNAGDFARIVDKYGAGNPGTITNPNLAANPAAVPVPPTVAPISAAGPTGAPGETALPDPNAPPENPNHSVPVDPVENPNDFSIAPSPQTIGPQYTGQAIPLSNPNTGAPVAGNEPKPPVDDESTRQADFIAKGGSLAQFHRAEVKEGLRPAIDARTRHDPLGSTASSDIRKANGFGTTPQATATGMANQMTNEFNDAHAATQQAWRQKFTDAHAKLMETLKQDN